MDWNIWIQFDQARLRSILVLRVWALVFETRVVSYVFCPPALSKFRIQGQDRASCAVSGFKGREGIA